MTSLKGEPMPDEKPNPKNTGSGSPCWVNVAYKFCKPAWVYGFVHCWLPPEGNNLSVCVVLKTGRVQIFHTDYVSFSRTKSNTPEVGA